jgi:Domain of unknown function (DUF4258)
MLARDGNGRRSKPRIQAGVMLRRGWPIFTKHALEEMKLRRVTRRDVRAALDNHDTTYPGTHPTRPTVVKIGTARGKRLAVVVDETNLRRVVTSYWKDEP